MGKTWKIYAKWVFFQICVGLAKGKVIVKNGWEWYIMEIMVNDDHKTIILDKRW